MAAAGKLDLGDLESDDDAAFYDNNDLANRIWDDNELETGIQGEYWGLDFWNNDSGTILICDSECIKNGIPDIIMNSKIFIIAFNLLSYLNSSQFYIFKIIYYLAIIYTLIS